MLISSSKTPSRQHASQENSHPSFPGHSAARTRRFHVADESQISEFGGLCVSVPIDLYLPYVFPGKKFRKRKIGPEHQKEIGILMAP